MGGSVFVSIATIEACLGSEIAVDDEYSVVVETVNSLLPTRGRLRGEVAYPVAKQAVRRYRIPEGINDEIAKLQAGFDSAILLKAIIRAFGGVERFAEELYHEYQEAEPGSPNRQKTLALVATLITRTDERLRGAADLDGLTLEELEATHAALVRKLSADGPLPALPGPDHGA
jgi:hypothetical protein